ncbi:MAG: ribbon-helix-helix protein, CopG family [Acidobacteria bacterium]|nr:ribbon-helix-helix protein, CopG family [Acidobacteriota bacterium]
MAQSEQTTNKVPISAKIDHRLYEVISELAKDEERSFSNMIERLLKQSPSVYQTLQSSSPETHGGVAK